MSGGILRVPSSYFGIVGDGKTFETAGIANLTNALAEYDVVELQDSPHILLGETFRLSDVAYTRLTTARDPNVEALERGPMFLWDGEPGGTMIELDRCRQFVLDGFAIQTDAPRRDKAPAGIGVLLDGGQDTNPESHAFGSTCTLSRLRHLTFPDPDPANPLDVEATFIANALTTRENQEKHDIVRCSGNGNGRGYFFHQGPSYNAKNIRLFDAPNIDHYRKAILMDNGSVKLSHLNMSNNEWDLWAGASTGYVVEEHHLGEASYHHAFVNCPYVSRYGTFDLTRLRPRSVAMQGLPTYADEQGVVYPEAWIMFGGFATDVEIARCAVTPPYNMNSRLFGWMYDRSLARYELGPFWLGPGHTKSTLGIDTPTLKAIHGTPKIIFHNRAMGTNPGGGGPVDLPGGELVLNSSGTAYIGGGS